jgi:hypothetical protein
MVCARNSKYWNNNSGLDFVISRNGSVSGCKRISGGSVAVCGRAIVGRIELVIWFINIAICGLISGRVVFE